MTHQFKAVLSFKTIKRPTDVFRLLCVDYAFNNLKESEEASDSINQDIFALSQIFTDIAESYPGEYDKLCYALPPSTIYIQSEKSRASVHYVIDITPAYRGVKSFDELSKHDKIVEFMQNTQYSFDSEEYNKYLSDNPRKLEDKSLKK